MWYHNHYDILSNYTNHIIVSMHLRAFISKFTLCASEGRLFGRRPPIVVTNLSLDGDAVESCQEALGPPAEHVERASAVTGLARPQPVQPHPYVNDDGLGEDEHPATRNHDDRLNSPQPRPHGLRLMVPISKHRGTTRYRHRTFEVSKYRPMTGSLICMLFLDTGANSCINFFLRDFNYYFPNIISSFS